MSRLLRTAAFRLALAYAGLFALSTAVVFVFVYVAVTDYAEEQIEELIEDEADALLAQAEADGPESVAATLRTWDATDRDRPASYAVVDAAGRIVAGDLDPVDPREGWFDFFEPADDDDLMLGLGTWLPDGSLLVVAQETDRQELGTAVIGAFAWAGGASIVLAVLGGIFTSAAFLRRLESFNLTAGRIIDGRLGERMPKRGTSDEFDRLADNLNAMLDRIQALMESMRQVSNDIAHDLRTPLSHLRQRLESARNRAGDVAAYEEAVDGAIAETDEILATFGALLRIAQIEAGTRRAGFRDVDLSALFETIGQTYAAVAEDNEQTLVIDLAPAVTVHGDRELLTQMLANLVENAISHTPPGCTIRISLIDHGGRPLGIVADDGPGIPAEIRDKVLQRFFRVETSRTTPGNGLGLSLVAAVAELHAVEVRLADASPGLIVELRFPHRPGQISGAGDGFAAA